MPRVLAALLAPPLLIGCAPSLDAGRVAVVSVFARYERGDSARTTGSVGTTGATTVGVTVGTARPPSPRRPLSTDQATDTFVAKAGPLCAHPALCAWEASAAQSALIRFRPIGGPR